MDHKANMSSIKTDSVGKWDKTDSASYTRPQDHPYAKTYLNLEINQVQRNV